MSAVASGEDVRGVFRGRSRRAQGGSDATADEAMPDKSVGLLAEKREWARLLESWVSGMSVDWRTLYPGRIPRRLSLPTYPFARERYWVPEAAEGAEGRRDVQAQLHPLLHTNTSDLTEQRFTSVFDSDEQFLSDHLVAGVRTLPGAAHLEMAVAAAYRAMGPDEGRTLALSDVVFVRPVTVVRGPAEVHIAPRPRRR